MERFGQYVAVRELHHIGFSWLWSARPISGGGETFAVKVLSIPETEDLPADKPGQSPETLAFLARTEVQRKVAVAAPGRWAPIAECGATATGAFYVTTRYARSLQNLIVGRVHPGPAALYRVVRSIIEGLQDLDRVCGRAHGALTPGNVLIDGDDLEHAKIVLTDPADDWLVAEEGLSNDLRALGELIYQMVCHRGYRDATRTPVEASPEWNGLRGRRTAWRRFCRRLLGFIDEEPFTSLEQVAAALRGLTPPVSRRSQIMAACVILILMLAASFGGYRFKRYRADLSRYRSDYDQWIAQLQSRAREFQAAYGSDPNLAPLLNDLNRGGEGQSLDPSNWNLRSWSNLSAVLRVDSAMRADLDNWRAAEAVDSAQLQDLGYANSATALQRAANALNEDSNLCSNMESLLVADKMIGRINSALREISGEQAAILADQNCTDKFPSQFVANSLKAADDQGGQSPPASLADHLENLRDIIKTSLLPFLQNQWKDVDVDYFERHFAARFLNETSSSPGELREWENTAISQAKKLPPPDVPREQWEQAQNRELQTLESRCLAPGGPADDSWPKEMYQQIHQTVEDDLNQYVSLPWNRENEAALELSQRSVEDDLAALEKHARDPSASDPESFLYLLQREPVVPHAPSRLAENRVDPINAKWREFRDQLVQDKRYSADALRDHPEQFPRLESLVDRNARVLLGVSEDFWPADNETPGALEEAIWRFRAKAVAAALPPQQISAAGITVDAAVLGTWTKAWEVFLQQISAVSRDADALTQLLDEGYRLTETDSNGDSIDSLARRLDAIRPEKLGISADDFALFHEQRLQPLLDRVAQLQTVDAMNDPDALLDAALKLGAPPEIQVTAWWKVASTPNVSALGKNDLYEVGEFGQQLIQTLSPRRPAIDGMVKAVQEKLWLNLVASASDPADPDLDLALDVAEPLLFTELTPATAPQLVPHFEKEGLTAPVIFNLLVSVARHGIGSGDDLAVADAKRVIANLHGEIAGVRSLQKAYGDIDALYRSSLAQPETPLNDSQDGPGGWALAGAGSWTKEKSNENSDSITFSLKGNYPLTFRRLPDTKNSAYFCTTAVPLDLFVFAVQNALGGPLSDEVSQTIFPGGVREGPCGWKYQDNLVTQKDDREFWFQSFRELTDAEIGLLLREKPIGQSPAQYVSPLGAAYFAALMGCRLPTVDEWKAAADLNFKSAKSSDLPISLHLRGDLWSTANTLVNQQQAENIKRAFYSPEQVAEAAQDDENDIWNDDAIRQKIDIARGAPLALDKQSLWFKPVQEGGGIFPNLIGNVACYVLKELNDSPDSQFWQHKSPDNLLMLLENGNCGVIGGSALSPSSCVPDVPKYDLPDPGFRDPGYCDVGIRLAFTPRSLPLAVQLRDAIRHARAKLIGPAVAAR